MFEQTIYNIPYIDFDYNAVPYKFSIKLAGKTFTFEFEYNQRGDFYTCNLYRGGEPLVLGDILRYGRPLFGTVRNNRFPKVDIMPLCISQTNIDRITKDNMGRQVKLYIYEQVAK